MAHRLTFRDLIDHAATFLGLGPGGAASRAVRIAVQDAVREVTEHRRWTYLLRSHRIYVPAQHVTGTVSYDHTGGASERLLTFSSATLPTWAGSGVIEFDNRRHKVSSKLSTSTLQLDATLNPGDDVAATSYILWQNLFALPEDFVTLDMPYGSERFKMGRSTYSHQGDWLALEQDGDATGSPWLFRIVGDPDAADLGKMVIESWGPPAAQIDADMLYVRRPRMMQLSGYKSEHTDGTVSTASNTTLTGSGTSFADAFEGAIVRVSDHATKVPTGIDGEYPYAEERVLDTFTSTTSFSVTPAFSLTASGKKYVISDPVDADPIMYRAIKAGVDWHCAKMSRHRDMAMIRGVFDRALSEANSLDASRVFKPAEVGDGSRSGPRPPGFNPPDSVG